MPAAFNFVEGFAVLCAAPVSMAKAVSVAGAVFVAKAVYMTSAFQCFAFLKKRNVILNLFQHLIPLFLFMGLAYAELKVNFVEGFAVLWLRRLSGIISLLSH